MNLTPIVLLCYCLIAGTMFMVFVYTGDKDTLSYC